MAVLRLFASARDAAGTGRDTMPGATVDEVLEAARARYGTGFAEVLDRCRVWCNGEPVTGSEPVGDGDEVAVLPPVSGGSVPAWKSPEGPPSVHDQTLPIARIGTRRRVSRTGARRAAIPEQVTLRGKTRQVVTRSSRRSLLGRRYAVVYDVEGPRIRLGILWFAAVVAGLVVGPALLVPLYAASAGWAGHQIAMAWRAAGLPGDPWLAAAGAAAITAVAAFGVPLVGVVVLALVLLAVVIAASGDRRRAGLLAAAGTTMQSALFPGLAGAGVVLTLRLEIGATVVLLMLVAVYEIGDYVVGSGASSSFEGPAAGAVAVAVASFVVAVLRAPPFDGAEALVFGGFVAVGCPLGQLFGSAVLPSADAHAPALRRLDSLLVLAPAWALLIGIYLERSIR